MQPEPRIITHDQISRQVAEMCVAANRRLPGDITRALEKALAKETSEQGTAILEQLLLNARVAGETGLPLCQDTGLAVLFVEIGDLVCVDGPGLQAALEEGVRQGYAEGLLRKSVCHPFTRQNSGTNLPAIIHYEIKPGRDLKISFMAKGGGSENMSAAIILTPAAGWEGIKKFVVERVCQAGPNPCPPIILGLGIGGNLEQAAILSKKALLRSLDEANPDPDLAAKEEELLLTVNRLGIGPMGLGGQSTCLGVKIMMQSCHIASLPVALTIQCHSARHASVVL